MQTTVLLYRLYDVADEINLETVETILSAQSTTSRLRLSRIPPKSIHIQNPPVGVELGGGKVSLGGTDYDVFYSARVYDLGVVSIIMRVGLAPGTGYGEMKRLSLALEQQDDYEKLFRTQLEKLQQVMSPALVKKGLGDVEEDFTVFFFTDWQEDWDPLPLLLGEEGPFSDWVRRETLRNSFSYSPDDLVIITWDSALVYDASGSTDLPDLLEFANSQLLELRYYDGLLTGEMEKMYDDLALVERGSSFQRLRHYRSIMARLMEVVTEVTDITERIHNSIKVTEDIYYARIYSAALGLFRTGVWMESIQRKMAVIQQNYSMLSDEIVTARATWLEVAIVLLITLEIILGLLQVF
ncbi:hypothetical protein [Desulfoscipio geothermicus]|uniref:DUF155 domain-containing protein n=1 Tax=Desulfoscipio geothermicus DSM 3669 TaxID=1121426 RepID=A0A1I6D4L7_9FIRM|nr:hypothetical protein [Desulfoscipio geothermicus]SFR00331.1 hypothetical protein SAMN05660706_10578 [Desulfoscipio geothermicus DSM 3669]